MTTDGAITFALILQKFRLRLSYTCAHKSGAFALSFGVTLAPIYSQLFLCQLLVFEPRCKKIGIRGSVFESLSHLNLKPSYEIPGFPRCVLKCSILKIKKLKCKYDCVVKRTRLKLYERVSEITGIVYSTNDIILHNITHSSFNKSVAWPKTDSLAAN